MAEFNAFATAYGRHGAADPASNIDPTDARADRYPLGFTVEGDDADGYWGRWWWGVYAESITVGATTKPILAISNAALSATIMWTVIKTIVTVWPIGYQRLAGTVEATTTATYKGWIRTHGYVPGMIGLNSGTRTIGLPVAAGTTAATLELHDNAADVGGQIAGFLAVTSTTAAYDVHLNIPFLGKM
jgi:hypothetical protein